MEKPECEQNDFGNEAIVFDTITEICHIFVIGYSGEKKKPMAHNKLEKELQVFKEKQPDLKEKYPNGGFVVINDEEVLGVWESRNDALKEGIKAYGNVSFLVRDIHQDPDNLNPLKFSKDLNFA